MMNSLRDEIALEKLLNPQQKTPVIERQIAFQPTEPPRPEQLQNYELNDRDVELQSQIDSILRTTRDIPRIRFKNAISKEMIEDYMLEQSKPIEVNGELFRFHTIPEPELEAPLEKPEEPDVQELQRLIEYHQELTAVLKKIDEKLTNLPVVFNLIVGRHPEQKEGLLTDYISSKKKLESDRADINTALQNTEAHINEIQQTLRQETNDYNTMEKARRERNQRAVKNYSDTLKLMNRQSFNMTQEIGESDEDYLARIRRETAALPDASSVEERALLDEVRKFKRNFKSLSQDVSLAERVLGLLNEDDPLFVYEINKIFPFFLTEYKKRYGENLQDTNIADFMKKIFTLPIEKEEPQDETLAKKIRVLKPFTLPELVDKIKQLYEIFGDVKLKVNGNEVELYEGKKGNLIVQYTRDGKNFKRSLIQAPKEVISTVFVGMMEKSRGTPEHEMINAIVNEKTGGKYGEGLKTKLPRWCPFGSVEIGLHKLFHQNIISVRNPRTHLQVVGFKSAPVSHHFANAIVQMCEGKDADFKLFSPSDNQIFDVLLHVAGLEKNFPTQKNKTAQALKNRLQLVEGEIGAGNTSRELKSELNSILHHLYLLGCISLLQARQRYRDIIDV